MTYNELVLELLKLPYERLSDTVTIYDTELDEFLPVERAVKTTKKTLDVLDPGHLVLEIKHSKGIFLSEEQRQWLCDTIEIVINTCKNHGESDQILDELTDFCVNYLGDD